MKILAIETSCDDTCAAIVDNDRLISNVISSQIDLHQEWGGVVPNLAKRAHQERIDLVINRCLAKITHRRHLSEAEFELAMKDIDFLAVTIGPGLAIALSVGVNKAKELSLRYNKPLIPVNHIEGHILSPLLKNQSGKPFFDIEFPILSLTASGGHSQITIFDKIGNYQIVGQTLDDAAGEALDKAAKLLKLGYPGGPIIEQVSSQGDPNYLKLPSPLPEKTILDYSFSGLKTSFYYQIKDWSEAKISANLPSLAASFQQAVFNTLLRKYRLAVLNYQPKTLFAGGGVFANTILRRQTRLLAKNLNLPLYFPQHKIYNTDNAAMIALVAYYQVQRGEHIPPLSQIDINSRIRLPQSTKNR